MSDVTKQMSIRIAGLLAVVVIVVALGLTLLRPRPAEPEFRPPLAERVPGAVLPVAAADVLPGIGADAPIPDADQLDQTLLPLIAAKSLGSRVSIDVMDR